MIQFTLYERLLRSYQQRSGKVPGAFAIFILSAIAKFVASFTTYPLLSVKSRQQVNKSNQKFGSALSVISEIFQREGIAGFFRGVWSKQLQSVLSAATMLLLKDRLLRLAISIVRK